MSLLPDFISQATAKVPPAARMPMGIFICTFFVYSLYIVSSSLLFGILISAAVTFAFVLSNAKVADVLKSFKIGSIIPDDTIDKTQNTISKLFHPGPDSVIQKLQSLVKQIRAT